MRKTCISIKLHLEDYWSGHNLCQFNRELSHFYTVLSGSCHQVCGDVLDKKWQPISDVLNQTNLSLPWKLLLIKAKLVEIAELLTLIEHKCLEVLTSRSQNDLSLT